MVNWKDEDIQEFKDEARVMQQTYCNLLGGRWDIIKSWQWTHLRKKVGFAIFGPPTLIPCKQNLHTGYSKDRRKLIEDVCDMLVKGLDFDEDDIDFACIFIAVKVHDERYNVPVFRVRSDDDNDTLRFVDITPRKYSDWTDFLKNNQIEKCIYCYPHGGKYRNDRDNDVRIRFGTSPACDFSSRFLSATDTLIKIVSFGITTAGLVALMLNPISGPLLTVVALAGTATSIYEASRSAHALYDRHTHGQTNSLDNAEARGHWVKLVSSVFGIALNCAERQMIKNMTNTIRARRVMGTAGRIAFNVVRTTRVTLKAVCIIQGFAGLVDKAERDKLTALDVYMFTASVLFFTNEVITYQTAESIIAEIRRDVYSSDLHELIED